MKKQLFNHIIKNVKLLCPNKRKPKYSPEYYLTNITDVLTDFVKWSSLKKSFNSNHDYVYHYKTISDIHRLWTRKGVYKKSYNELVKQKKLCIDDDNKEINLLIDSTLIINKSGVENIGYGSSCKKKKFTKLSAFSNTEGENVAIVCDPVYIKTIQKKKKNIIKDKCNSITSFKMILNGFSNVVKINDNVKVINTKLDKNIKDSEDEIKIINTKEDDTKEDDTKEDDTKEDDTKEDDTKEKNIIKTLSHDVKNVKPLIEDIKDITNGKLIKIYGDKGYVMNKNDKQKLLEEYNAKLIHSMRSNQTEKNTDEEEEVLSVRYKVENMFSGIKVFNRIHVRRDKLINNYMGFVFLGCIIKYGKC